MLQSTRYTAMTCGLLCSGYVYDRSIVCVLLDNAEVCGCWNALSHMGEWAA